LDGGWVSEDFAFDMSRISIVGTTGSGKSTLAMKAAAKLNCPFVELDALFWKSGWVREDRSIFREKVTAALMGECWVVGGNYSVARDIIWQRADALVWLDYSFGLVLSRLLRRTLKRVMTQEELWAGNRETWRNSFLSKDNLFVFALKTHWRRRRELPEELKREAYRHLQVLRFRKPDEAEDWLQTLVG
jgi:adenylate kinase family enzyme